MERIHKILARAGVASRRAVEKMILEGRITVNGQPAHIGQAVDPLRDDIRIDGRRPQAPPPAVWVLLHKPPGVVVSDRPQGRRKTVRQLVPLPGRLFPVGRLDVGSEGLVVLTNDGESAERLSHPRYEHEKEYRVLLDRPPEDDRLDVWRRGVVLADGHRTRPAIVRREPGGRSQRWIRLVLREGHKRQIRESARALGLRVERLVRIRVGPFHLGTLRPGEWRLATDSETARLGLADAARARRASAADRRGKRPACPKSSARRPAGLGLRSSPGGWSAPDGRRRKERR